MANVAPTIADVIDGTPEEFAAAYAYELVANKQNYDIAGNLAGPLPLELIPSKLTAEYVNFVDDFILECQSTKLRWVRSGDGSPEGVLTAPVGTFYIRRDGGAGTTHYAKESGTGNTGWVAFTTASSGSSVPLGSHAATSIVARAANSTGNAADLAATTLGHVLRRDATPALSFGTLLAGAFATVPGIVTPAMLDNGAARSLIGVTGNASAARADIAGAGTATAPQVPVDNGATLSFATLSTLIRDNRTIYDLDFSALATNPLADGTEVIGGINWTRVNSAADSVSAVTSGQGYQQHSTGAGTFLSGSQTAAYTYTTLALLLAAYGGVDGNATYVVDCYYSSMVRENGDAPFVGWWNSAETTLRGGALRFATGPIYNIGAFTSSGTYSTVDVGSTHNVLSVAVNPTGAGWVGSGVWSAGWPATIDSGMIMAAGTNQQGFSRSTTRLVLSLISGADASPTAAYTLARMRVRRAA